MKTTFPKYRETGVDFIEKKLTKQDKIILEDFLSSCSVNAGEGRLGIYKRSMLMLYDVAETSFDKFKNLKVRNGILTLIKNSDREEATKNDIKRTLKRFLKWKFKDLSLIEDIKISNKLNEKKINPNTLITDLEIEKLVRSADSLKGKAMVVTFIELGLRPQEILALRWRDIKLDDSELTIFSNKTRRTRTLPLNQSTIHLKRWKQEFEFPDVKPDDLVFPNPKNRDEQLNSNYMSFFFKRLSKRAGIRHIFPYLARHSTLTKVYKNAPDKISCGFAGHSPSMSERYTHLSSDDIKKGIIERVYNVKEITPEEKIELKDLKQLLEKERQERAIQSKDYRKEVEGIRTDFNNFKQMLMLMEKQIIEKTN